MFTDYTSELPSCLIHLIHYNAMKHDNDNLCPAQETRYCFKRTKVREIYGLGQFLTAIQLINRVYIQLIQNIKEINSTPFLNAGFSLIF